MKLESYRETFTLTGTAIDGFSDAINELLHKVKVEEQNILRIRLSMEEILLRMRDKYGSDKEVTGFIGKYRGKYVVRVESKGEAYNPLGADSAELEDLFTSLFASSGINPQYSYLAEENSVKITITPPRMNPVLKVFIAMAIGILIGVLGNALLSVGIRDSIIQLIMSPFYDAWNRVLTIISGPVILFMFTTSILNAGRINEQGGDTNRILIRYFTLSVVMTLIASLTAISITGFNIPTGVHMDSAEAKGVLEYILSIIPKDLVSPFVNVDSPQLLLMAFFLGSAMNIFGSQVSGLTGIVRQINALGLQLSEWIGRLVPYVLCLLVALEIWQDNSSLFMDVFPSLIVGILVSAVCVGILFFVVSHMEGIPVKFIWQTLKKSFLLVLKTGSLDASYGEAESCLVSGFGISKSFLEISLPTGLVFYMPISAVGTIIFTLFSASKFGIAIQPANYVFVIFLSILLAIAAPPVPGVELITFVALFSQLGIPNDALVSAMVFSVIFGMLASACNQLLLQLEMLIQSDRMGFLDRRVLSKKLNNS